MADVQNSQTQVPRQQYNTPRLEDLGGINRTFGSGKGKADKSFGNFGNGNGGSAGGGGKKP